MRNFENWETEDVETCFGLVQVWDNDLITDWLSATTELVDFEKIMLERIRIRTLKNVDFWNEDELKLQSIASILELADLTSEHYKTFSQRTLTATVNGIELGGRVDFMLAQGRQRPKNPYFFVHEYKQETKKGSSDPKGQLLSELVAAQQRNDNNFPLYGCYVVGRNWFFLLLNGKEYAVSNTLNASDSDIFKIVAMLRYVKHKIEKSLSTKSL